MGSRIVRGQAVWKCGSLLRLCPCELAAGSQSTADWLARDMGYKSYEVDWASSMLYRPFVALYFGLAYLEWLSAYQGRCVHSARRVPVASLIWGTREGEPKRGPPLLCGALRWAGIPRVAVGVPGKVIVTGPAASSHCNYSPLTVPSERALCQKGASSLINLGPGSLPDTPWPQSSIWGLCLPC